MLIISLLKRHLLGSKGWDHRRTCFVLIYSPDLTLYLPCISPCQRGWWDDNLMMPPWQDNHHHDNQSQSRVSHDTRRPGTHGMTPVWHFLRVYNQLQTSLWSPLPLHPRVASWLWHRVWGWRSDGGCPLPSPHAGLTFDQNWKYYCQKPGIPISQSCHI